MQNLRDSVEAGLRERLGHLRMKKENKEALIQDILEFVLLLIKDKAVGQVNTESQAVIMTPNASAGVDKLAKNRSLEPPQTI